MFLESRLFVWNNESKLMSKENIKVNIIPFENDRYIVLISTAYIFL